MKLKWLVCCAFGIAVLVGGSWYFSSSSDGKSEAADRHEVLRSRRLIKSATPVRRSEIRIREQKADRQVAKEAKPFDKKAFEAAWAEEKENGFDLDLDFDFDFDLDDVSPRKMSREVVAVLGKIKAAQARFDAKAVRASVRNLLAMASAGHPVAASAKIQALEALKEAGGGVEENLPEVVQLAADENPAVSTASIESLEDMLWDFDTTPQQIASCITQLLDLTTVEMILDPFINEMGELPMSLKLETTQAVYASANETAKKLLDDSISFIYDDFNGEIQTREDIARYAAAHPEEGNQD